MVDIANMRPSVLRRLHQDLADADRAEDFLDSLADYLASASPDGGVDTDRLYVIGLSLSNADVWERINPADVLQRAGHVGSDTLLAFTAGMPDAVARRFLETQIRENRSEDAQTYVVARRVFSMAMPAAELVFKEGPAVIGEAHRHAKTGQFVGGVEDAPASIPKSKRPPRPAATLKT